MSVVTRYGFCRVDIAIDFGDVGRLMLNGLQQNNKQRMNRIFVFFFHCYRYGHSVLIKLVGWFFI